MKRGTLTHSSGGRRLLAKRRNGAYWLHVEDGFAVVDMPISDDLAEQLADFLGGGSATGASTPGGQGPAANQSGGSAAAGGGSGSSGGSVNSAAAANSAGTSDPTAAGPGAATTSDPSPDPDCSVCRGTGETVGLFAGMRVRCPHCVAAA